MALIEIQNLSVAYGTPSRPVLTSIDLSIGEGEFVCVLGQTGCGKSTLLKHDPRRRDARSRAAS